MANINATIRAKIETPTQPTIYNLSCPLADTEYEQVLDANTKSLLIRARNSCEIKLGFESSLSTPEYLTIPRGTGLSIESINFSGSIFVRCSKNDSLIEILQWV
jgi:hypothetical protein